MIKKAYDEAVTKSKDLQGDDLKKANKDKEFIKKKEKHA